MFVIVSKVKLACIEKRVPKKLNAVWKDLTEGSHDWHSLVLISAHQIAYFLFLFFYFYGQLGFWKLSWWMNQITFTSICLVLIAHAVDSVILHCDSNPNPN